MGQAISHLKVYPDETITLTAPQQKPTTTKKNPYIPFPSFSLPDCNYRNLFISFFLSLIAYLFYTFVINPFVPDIATFFGLGSTLTLILIYFLIQWLSSATTYKNYFCYIFDFIFVVGLISIILWSLNILQNNVPASKDRIIVNYLISLGLMAIGIWLYYYYTKLKSKYSEREISKINKIQYFIILLLVILCSFVLFIFNPFQFTSTYPSRVIFFIMLSVISLLILIAYYSFEFSSITKYTTATYGKKSEIDMIYTIIGILISILFFSVLYFSILEKFGTTSSIIISVSSLVILLAIIYYYTILRKKHDTTTNTTTTTTTLFKIISLPLLILMYYILYYSFLGKFGTTWSNIYSISLLAILIFVSLYVFFSPSVELLKTKFEFLNTKIAVGLLASIIIFVIIYFYKQIPFISFQWKSGGKEIQLESIPLDSQKVLSISENLSSPNYDFALSFWIFIDSLPPSTNNSYTTTTNIINLNNNLTVQYNSPANAFVIGNTVIPNVQLQKWNQFVLNGTNGVLDIFYNGSLVGSISEIKISSSNTITVGTNNGISGSVSDIIYFSKPLSAFTIQYNYQIEKK